MALPTITLVNLTGSAITFRQLAVTLAAASTVIVSDVNRTYEILNDDELQAEIGSGNVRINITGGGLSSTDTAKTLEQSTSLIKPLHDLDIKHNLAGIIAPVATDDEDSGYSVGSFWIDEAADASYVCVDATSTAAEWNPIGPVTLQNAYVGGNTLVTDAENGDLDVSGTEAISLDAEAASNFTVAGADLMLETTGDASTTVSSDVFAILGASTDVLAPASTAGVIVTTKGVSEVAAGAGFDGLTAGNDSALIVISTGAASGVTGASGPVTLTTGATTDTATSGSIFINTGVNDGTGTSGEITVLTGGGLFFGAQSSGAARFGSGGMGPTGGGSSGDATFTSGGGGASSGNASYGSGPTTGPGAGGSGIVRLESGRTPGATASGTVTVITGDNNGTGDSGAVVVSSGAVATGGSGDVLLSSGDASSATTTGDVTIETGDQTAGAPGETGELQLRTGSSPSLTGTTGALRIETGTASGAGGDSGEMVIETGPTVSGVSGPIDLATGPSDGASGRSGAIVMDTGDAAIGPTSYAGDFDIRTGASFSTGEALPVGTINIIGGGNLGSDRTGNINITGGPNADAGVGLGGIVTITGGAATGSSGEAGDVLLVGGDASEPGKVILANAESADVDSDEVVFRYWNQGTGTGGGYFADFYVRDVAGDPDGAVTAQSGSLMIQVNGGAIPELWLNDTPGVLTGTDWSRVTTTSDVTLQQAYIGGNTIATSAPEGIFSVTGTEMIALMSTGANASLSALNVSITSLGAAAAGDVILTGGNSSGATNPGGDIFLNPGDGSTTGIGGTITGTGGIGGATGAGGGVSFTGGAGGLTNSIGGAVVFTGGPSTGAAVGGAANLLAGPGGQTGDGGKVGIAGGAGGLTSGDGGAAAITGGVPTDGDGGAAAITGASGVGTNRSGGIVTVGAGDSTGTATGAAVNVTGGNGDGLSGGNGGAVNITGGAGRIGGDVVITSGPPFDASDQAGDVHIIANKGVGTAGKIFLTTESDDDIIYPVTIDTQSGFADQGRNTRTFGRSEAVAISTLNQAVVNLGTLTNGDQLQVKVSMTAVDNLVDTNVVSFRFDGDFYMSGGTVTAMTPHVNNNTLVGTATFTGGISFAVVISGGTVLLEVSNSSGVSAFTLDISATFITQQGGAAA